MITSESPIPIVIVISALSEELHAFTQNPRNQDGNQLLWEGSVTIGNHFECQKGIFKLGDQRLLIYASHASDKMGMTEATLLATTAILSCELKHGVKPNMLAMIGLCGGRQKANPQLDKDKMEIGDIIRANKAVHFFFGKMTRNEKNNPEFDKDPQESSTHKTLYNHLINFFSTGGETRLSQIKTACNTDNKPNKDLLVHPGVIGSSDLVVADQDILLQAVEVGGRKTIAVDMESYSVLRVAGNFEVPGMVLKSVSDYADVNKGDKDLYRRYAYQTSANALYFFLEYLVEKTNFFLEKTNQI